MRGALACSAAMIGACFAQQFDVASIRPSSAEALAAGWSGITSARGRVSVLNSTLRDIIADAYEVAEDRIVGGPDWVYSDRFQIDAKAEQPEGKKMLDAMLRTLLAERFHLAVHRETRSRETLVLEIAKRGLRLEKVAPAYRSFENGHGRLDVKALTMAEFVEFLTHELRIPVVDRSGVGGSYKFTLRWNADRPWVDDPLERASNMRHEISTAMTQQLGLELKPRRVAAEMIVVERAARPTAN